MKGIRKANDMEERNGFFCELFGNTPRNKILEFFLEMKELDFSIGDISREIGLNRATTYNTMEELIKKKYIIPTRKVSGGQLYSLNNKKEDVRFLIKIFNLTLSKMVKERSKEMIYA